MVRIKEVRPIPLRDLEIGLGQARLSGVGKDISELADSIRKVGLLEPIVVAPSDQPGKFEILTGQRRFLAHQELQANEIMAAILDERVDETAAKVISLTENLVRRDLNRKDLIDACTYLYKKYGGSVRMVVEETGLPASKVREYIKYDRLIPELKGLVDEGMEVKTALRAQDAASVDGETRVEEAVKLAKEMAQMSGVQQEKLKKERIDEPDKPVEEVIEEAKSGGRITQIVVSLSSNVHRSLQSYAEAEDTNQDDAAASLITEGLDSKGFLGE